MATPPPGGRCAAKDVARSAADSSLADLIVGTRGSPRLRAPLDCTPGLTAFPCSVGSQRSDLGPRNRAGVVSYDERLKMASSIANTLSYPGFNLVAAVVVRVARQVAADLDEARRKAVEQGARAAAEAARNREHDVSTTPPYRHSKPSPPSTSIQRPCADMPKGKRRYCAKLLPETRFVSRDCLLDSMHSPRNSRRASAS